MRPRVPAPFRAVDRRSSTLPDVSDEGEWPAECEPVVFFGERSGFGIGVGPDDGSQVRLVEIYVADVRITARDNSVYRPAFTTIARLEAHRLKHKLDYFKVDRMLSELSVPEAHALLEREEESGYDPFFLSSWSSVNSGVFLLVPHRGKLCLTADFPHLPRGGGALPLAQVTPFDLIRVLEDAAEEVAPPYMKSDVVKHST